MEKGVIESQYLFILHQKLSENFYSHNVTEALKRDHHFLFYRGGNRPQENNGTKKKANYILQLRQNSHPPKEYCLLLIIRINHFTENWHIVKIRKR